jgi:hypothetical protein
MLLLGPGSRRRNWLLVKLLEGQLCAQVLEWSVTVAGYVFE